MTTRSDAPPLPAPPSRSLGVKVGITVLMLVSSALAVGAVLMKRENLRQTDAAPLARSRADIIHLEAQVRQYVRVTGELPKQEEGLAALVAVRVLNQIPTDPWGRPYAYEIQGNVGRIYSLGRDGKPGGEGDDADVYHPDVGR